jgi:hypothetical protein
MQNAFLDWLITDFDFFGLHLQYWMPVIVLVFVAFFVFSSLNERRFRK